MPVAKLPTFAPDLIALFEKRGTSRIDTPVIQPAAPFLDMAGEDLRRRIFLTESDTGASLCLRPEFTIPVCLQHIESATGTPKRYAYLGQVFRQRREGANEFYQAGIEDLGDRDVASADARAISDAFASLKLALPGRTFTATLGDQSVFEAVVKALGLPSGWQKRLIHAFGNASKIKRLLDELANPPSPSELPSEFEQFLPTRNVGNALALESHIALRMQETGYLTNASRSPEEIATRLFEKRALAATRLDPKALDVLEEFLSLDLPFADAAAALAGFADAAGLKLDGALSRFDARAAALANAGVDLKSITYRAAFGRPLDYYTGLVFEIAEVGKPAVLAGGGRYDRMLTLLGAKDHIPAVGFSLWLDRIEATKGDAR
jgi:ATP phosphoribosyltransferase regulatory subunit